MSQPKPTPSIFSVQNLLSLATLIVSAIAAYQSEKAANQANKAAEKSNLIAEELGTISVQQQDKQIALNTYLQSYDLVTKAIDKKDQIAAKFARLSITKLNDTKTEEELLQLLKEGMQRATNAPNTNKEKAKELRNIVKQTEADQIVLDAKRRAEAEAASLKPSEAREKFALQEWRVQVLHCQNKDSALNNATKIASFITKSTGAKTYLTAIYSGEGANVANASANVNYTINDSKEKRVAAKLASQLNAKFNNLAEFKLRPVRTDYPQHMSVYICK